MDLFRVNFVDRDRPLLQRTLSFKQIFIAFILVRDVKIIVINISIRSSKRKNVF